MGLPSDLVTKLVKVTHDRGQENTNFTVYGTVTTDGTRNYVKIDGSDISTPIESTVEISEGDRVRVEVKNHIATATGNITDPSIGTKTANGLRSEISQTAAEIRMELTNEIAGLNSSLTLTASEIRSEVANEVSGLNSKITQTASDIRSEVANEVSGLKSTISQTATDIRAEVADEVKGLNAKITLNAEGLSSVVTKQNEFSEFKQTVEGFSFMGKGGTVKISGGDITLTGAIKFSDLSDATTKQAEIDAAKSTADSASSTASDAYDLADTAWDKADNALDTVSGWAHSKNGTYIDGEMIYSDSIYADSIHLGGALKVYRTKSGSTLGGYLGYDSGFNSSAGIGMRYQTVDEAQAKKDDEDIPVYSQVVCTNNAARLSYGDPDAGNKYSQVVADSTGEVSLAAYSTSSGKGHVYLKRGKTVVVQTYNDNANNMLIPGSDSKIYLGKSDKYWIAVYSDNYYGGTANATGSDRNLKNSIEDLPDKYVELFDRLRPVRYKLNSGTSDRYHVGYIAQEVEEAMTTAGIDSQEFGGLVKDKNEDGTYTYMLRYGEFDGIYAAKIKQLEARVAALEER